jgi:hypothetical protein
MDTASAPFYVPPASLFESGFTHVQDTFIAVKNFLSPVVVFLAHRVKELWIISEPYVQAFGIFLSTKLGIGIACISIAILPISLSRTITNKVVATITLIGGIAIALTGFYFLGSVGVLPAFQSLPMI